MSNPPPRRSRLRAHPIALAGLLALGACAPRTAPAPSLPASASPASAAPGAAGTLKERIAAFTLRQVAFGSVSLIPVRFERSRISQAFLDGGRTLYCVSTRMRGRDLFESERPRIVVEERGGTIRLVDEDEEICHGHRTEPFLELDTPESGKS